MKLRVGIVGLGETWDTRHRPALRALSDRFDVRAVCAEVALRAERAAREFDATALDGFRAMTIREDVDAILVLSPDWVGTLPILAACEAGKAVYSTAALHIDPLQAKQIKDRVESSGIAFMAEFPRRHAPATLRLKELIATKLGKPKRLFCHERVLQPTDQTRRNGGEASSVREMMELVDWCSYIVAKPPASVVGVQHKTNTAEDYHMLSLEFPTDDESAQGEMAQISCGHYSPDRWRDAISFRPPAALKVDCERGVAFVDLPSSLIWFDEAGQHHEALESERPVGEQLLMQFHRSVMSLVRKTSDLEDAYRALHAVLTAKASCEQGRRLTLLS